MRYGLYLPGHGILADAGRLASLAHEAEQAGWDGFFLWDHVTASDEDTGNTYAVVDPWIALTAVALQTKILRFGTTVTPLPRRRPWKLARETASLDRLSGGRLILGVGIGLGDAEWGDLGEETNSRKRGQMLDEGLDVLTGLWTGEPFSYTGQYYQIKNAHFIPRPLQQPRIPIWIGGFWGNKAPFKRMAKWDGMFPLFDVFGPDQDIPFQDAVEFVRGLRTDTADSFDVIKLGVSPMNDPVEAKARIQPAIDAGATWWLELLIPEIYGEQIDQESGFEVLRQRVLAGPPQLG